jgi:tetratricopeptide (TPR) repeat protein
MKQVKVAAAFEEAEMIRLLLGLLIIALAGAVTASQQSAASSPQQNAPARPDKPEVLRQIALYEAEARSGEAAHNDPERMAKIYVALGILYADAGMYLKSEDATRRAIALMKNGPQGELADEFGLLAVLHVVMGEIGQAERDEMRAMQARQAQGDPLGIALTEDDLAGLYNEERKFKKALDYAQKAFAALADRTDVSAVDRIAVRETLGFALIGTRSCEQGIAMLKDGLDLSNISLGADSVKQGYAEYVLGFGYWHCGNRDQAAAWMGHGTTRMSMKADFGWDRGIYVNAMSQYARFLRETGQQEAAVAAETVVHQAQSVVDANALTGRAEGFRSTGSK